MNSLKNILKKITFLIIIGIHVFTYADEVVKIKFPNAEILNQFTTRIPIKLIDHLIVIEAEIENRTGNFIIDTGSESLILNKVHFPEKYNINKKEYNTSGILNYIDNPIEKRLKQFNIKNFNLKNKISDVINLSHIEESKKIEVLGIIGFSILKDYEIFVDLYLNQITLTKTDKKGNKLYDKVYAEKIADSINFNLKNHMIVLQGQVMDENVSLGFDTAAEINLINKNAKRKVLKHFQPSERLNLRGASGKTIEIMAGNLYRVKLSETVYVGPMKTMLTNLNKMNTAFGTRLDGIIGYEFLKYKRTIINYKKEKLYFINYPKFKL